MEVHQGEGKSAGPHEQ